MGELEDRLNGILNNPQEMEKIMDLARNFMGDSGGTPSGGGVPPGGGAPAGNAAPPVQEGGPAPSNSGGLEGLLGGLNLDPGLLGKLAGGLAAGVGSTAILDAITPHLKEERRAQLKRAITIAQVVKVARVVFSDRGGGDG